MKIVEKLFVGVLKEKKKDNQYKLKKVMAITIGLTTADKWESMGNLPYYLLDFFTFNYKVTDTSGSMTLLSIEYHLENRLLVTKDFCKDSLE